MLHVQMDTFLDMLPPAYLDHADGLQFRNVGSTFEPSISISAGPIVQKTLRAMKKSIAVMAREDNDVVVDDVLLGSGSQEYREALAGLDVSWVAVMADLVTLEMREKQRADRMIGLARWQFDRVHFGIDYDVVVNTDVHSPKACARIIKQKLGL